MSSNLETRISRNIARQKENFKRQQKIISSFNEDFLNNDDNNNSAINEVEPSRFMNELDASLSQIRATGNEEADLDGNGGVNCNDECPFCLPGLPGLPDVQIAGLPDC